MADEAKKTRKKSVVRTDADLLKMGAKGNVFLVVRKAFALGAKNGFKGSVRKDSKYPSGVLYSKGKDGGAYWGLKEDSSSFNSLKSAAKAAIASLTKLEYNDKVVKVIDEFTNIGGGSRGGSATNMSSLADVKL